VEYQVILNPQALQDLEEIHDYIAADNPASAHAFREKLLHVALGLRTFPKRGSSIKAEPDVRFILCRPYLIIYWIKKDRNTVQVLRFWHGARDIGQLKFEDG
jgi:toxin ParE1/3/4